MIYSVTLQPVDVTVKSGEGAEFYKLMGESQPLRGRCERREEGDVWEERLAQTGRREDVREGEGLLAELLSPGQ